MPSDVKVHALPITPEMREAAMSGQPLFSKKRIKEMDEQAGILNKAKATKKKYNEFVGKQINAFNDAMGWRYSALGKLPSQKLYLAKRYETLGKIANVDHIAKDIYSVFSKASEADQKAVYEYMTTKDATTNGIENGAIKIQAKKIKRLIDTVGKALVERGLISEQAYEDHKDAYLPRIYLKYLLTKQDWKALGAGKKPSSMGYTKHRQEIPESVREAILGEITDPGYLASVSVGRTLRDMAILDFLEAISDVKEWIFPEMVVNWNGRKVSVYWLKSEAERLRLQLHHMQEGPKAKAEAVASEMEKVANPILDQMGKVPADFKQVPNTMRYGRLRGLYVRKEIFNDIVGEGNMQPSDPNPAEYLFGYGGLGTKVTQLWKMSKVALNPPTQVRNFVSNGVLLQLSGVPMHKVPLRVKQAFQQILSGSKEGREVLAKLKMTPVDTKHWDIAKKYGIESTTFNANELYRIERELLDVQSRMEGKWSWAHIKNLAGIIGDFAGDTYQFSESIFKTAKIIDAMEADGMGEVDAMLEAQKWLFDYSLVPQSVGWLRNAPVGVPFITFYYKALPRMIEVATTHPERFFPWLAVPAMLTAWIATAYDVDDDDVKALKKALPVWLQERGNAYILPYKDADGRWQAVDIGYFLPWSMFTEAAKNVADGEIGDAIKTTGIIGGPIPELIVAIKSGTDSFTGKPIYHEGDPGGRQVADIMGYLWRLSAPTFITDVGFAGHAYRAATNKIDLYGQPRSTGVQATLRLFGVNVYPIDPKLTRAQNLRRMEFEIKDTVERLNKKMKDRNLSRKDRAELYEEYRIEIEARKLRMLEYKRESKVRPALQ